VLPLRVVASELTCDAVVVGAARAASDALRDEVFRAAADRPGGPVEGASTDDETSDARDQEAS